jgi:hypothetical protein
MYTSFVHVDSRVRFLNGGNELPHKYRFDLPRTMRSVREIELFRAEVPSSMYNVRADDPPFQFVAIKSNAVTGEKEPYVITWTIPPGAYTLATIVEKLNYMKDRDHTLMVQDLAQYTTFAYDANAGTISLSTQESYITYVWFPFYALGIDRISHERWQTTLVGSRVLVSEYPVRLNVPAVLFLSIPEVHTNGGTSTDIETHSNLNGHGGNLTRHTIVARLQCEAGAFNVNYFGSENRIYLRHFPPGVLNLTYLTITFTDALGRHVDFNGADHSLFFRIAYESR